jgi:hypothetical protein
VNTSSFGIVTVILLGPEQIDEVLLPLFRGLRFPNSRPRVADSVSANSARLIARLQNSLAVTPVIWRFALLCGFLLMPISIPG